MIAKFRCVPIQTKTQYVSGNLALGWSGHVSLSCGVLEALGVPDLDVTCTVACLGAGVPESLGSLSEDDPQASAEMQARSAWLWTLPHCSR